MIENNFSQDAHCCSVAQVLASANRQAKELGVDVKESLITVSQHLANGVWLRRVHYGKRDYIGRRGGDLMIYIDGVICGHQTNFVVSMIGKSGLYGNVIRTGMMLNSTKDNIDELIAALDKGFAML